MLALATRWERLKRIVSVSLHVLLMVSQSGTTDTTTPDASEDELLAPHSVTLEARTENSLTILWKMAERSPNLSSFTVRYYSEHESEKVESVSAEDSSKFLHNLQPATNYTVYVTAHYVGNRSASSPKCVMTTRDSSNSIHKDCGCSAPGTATCERDDKAGEKCVCRFGFAGYLCDECSSGFYQWGDECRKCPCPRERSHETCELSPDVMGEVSCSCREGYLGPLCNSCVLGFYPVANGERCVKCQCLFCHNRETESVSCDRCPSYSFNITDLKALKLHCGSTHGYPRSQQRTIDHGDGTVAIVAAFVSLAFIACVAGSVTCYRRRLQARNQPPFWSIELTEDKMSLNSGSEYERLGEGSSKQHLRTSQHHRRLHERSPSVAEATAAQRAANQPQYNCISI